VSTNFTHNPASGIDRVTRFSVIKEGCTYRIDQTEPPHTWRESFYHDGTNWYAGAIPPGDLMVTNSVRFTERGPVTTALDKPAKMHAQLRTQRAVDEADDEKTR